MVVYLFYKPSTDKTKITFSKRTLYTIVILLHLRRDNKLLELYLEHNPRQKKEEAIPLWIVACF